VIVKSTLKLAGSIGIGGSTAKMAGVVVTIHVEPEMKAKRMDVLVL
jgi:hypothetical protein